VPSVSGEGQPKKIEGGALLRVSMKKLGKVFPWRSLCNLKQPEKRKPEMEKDKRTRDTSRPSKSSRRKKGCFVGYIRFQVELSENDRRG